MPPSRRKRSLALVTSFWGEHENEETAIVRLVAGALAGEYDIDVVHLDTSASETRTFSDSAFRVRVVPVSGLHHLQPPLLRAALGNRRTGDFPTSLRREIDSSISVSADIPAMIDEIDPEVVLLCGTFHPYQIANLKARRHRRIIFMPISHSLSALYERDVASAMSVADLAIGDHPGEVRILRQLFPERQSDVVELDLALSINRNATSDTLFGVRFFQPFVLLIRSFGDEHNRSENTITHEIITSVAGALRREDVSETQWRYTDDDIPDELPVSVAEVNGDNWRLTDNINLLPLPVSPTRVNLWRLMAHALFMIDLRPASPFGRETLEAMMFDSPAIVPEHTAAQEHVKAANGGLWYRTNGELLDAVRVLTDRTIRAQLADNGRRYVDAHHSDLQAFVNRITRFVSENSSR